MNSFDLVLFDFDGTMAHTAHDMINALNMLLSQHDKPAVAYKDLRAHVSNGTPALLRHGFGCGPGDPEFEPLRDEFLEIYQRHLCIDTVLYPGFDALLARLDDTGIAWGIVTNKPEHLTRQIVAHLGIASRVACIVGGDTLKQRKPDPEPVTHACKLAGSAPEKSVYIGDSWRDIEAGRRAGLTTVGVSYGYIPPDDDPQQWGADIVIHAVEDIAGMLWNNRATGR